MSMLARAPVYLVGLLILVLLASWAEAAGPVLALQQVDSSEFPNVKAYVGVTTSQALPVTGLDARAFDLFEDGKAVSDFRVESAVDSKEPIAVALIVDVSGSMAQGGKLDGAKQAANTFVDAMGSADSVAIVSFANQVNILKPGYSTQKADLKAAIGNLVAGGETALYDAIVQTTLLQGGLSQRRKVLLVLTDGYDTSSVRTLDASIAAAKDVGAPVIAVGLGGEVRKDILDKLASGTGGKAIYVPTPDLLTDAFKSVSDQLRTIYVLQYTSRLAGDDKVHSLTVRTEDPNLGPEASGSFVARRIALGIEVKGIATATEVTGAQQIEVAVTAGTASRVELLVDGEVRGTSAAAPHVFQWDASDERAGPRRVLVRAVDVAGGVAEKEYVVVVVLQTPEPAPEPTPTLSFPASTPTPVPFDPGSTGTSPLVYAAAGMLAFAVVGGGGILLGRTAYAQRRRESPVAPLPPAPSPAPAPLSEVQDRIDVAARPVVAEPAEAAGVSATAVSPVAPALRARLRIIHQGSERDVYLDRSEAILGRDATNTVVIGDSLTSRRHARITFEGGEYWIEDLKSLNGTRVNGEPIARRKLAAGDVIRIGDALLTFLVEPKQP